MTKLAGRKFGGGDEGPVDNLVQKRSLLRLQFHQKPKHVDYIEQLGRIFRQPVVRLDLAERRRRAAVADLRLLVVLLALAEPLAKHRLARHFISPDFGCDWRDDSAADL